MQVLQKTDASSYMNYLGKSGLPFLFIIDFDQRKPLVLPLESIDPEILQYDFRGLNNRPPRRMPELDRVVFEPQPISFSRYERAYALVQQYLHRGDSYLLNLTFPTRLKTNLSIRQMFEMAEAPYRLWWRGQFACFSPESFVRIRGGKIRSYPMKGTVAADIPQAPRGLLENPKEKAEHATIVDLIRNDLSQVASRVRVDRFRYLEQIHTRRGGIWQSSSEISGELPANYHEKIGDLIFKLLPAGSISGAPKPKTVAIIREAEGYERGYYTGVAGIFDGQDLDSAVLIRYVEESPDGLYFKSGGGITSFSEVEAEYRELIRKVDLPVAAKVESSMGA